MCLSIYFAQVIGLYLVIISLATLIRHERFKKIVHEFLASAPLIAISGGLGVMIGLIILVPHHLWVAKWPVIITIIGWIALLQGIQRLFFPESFVKWMKNLMDKKGPLLWSWVWFLVGCYLVWAGFTQ